MKRLIAATALALFGLAPAIASPCDDHASMAATTPPEQLAAAPAPAATKASATKVAKAPAPKSTKQASANVKEPARDAKVAMASTD